MKKFITIAKQIKEDSMISNRAVLRFDDEVICEFVENEENGFLVDQVREELEHQAKMIPVDEIDEPELFSIEVNDLRVHFTARELVEWAEECGRTISGTDGEIILGYWVVVKTTINETIEIVDEAEYVPEPTKLGMIEDGLSMTAQIRREQDGKIYFQIRKGGEYGGCEASYRCKTIKQGREMLEAFKSRFPVGSNDFQVPHKTRLRELLEVCDEIHGNK